MKPPFIPGLELSAALYAEVEPILRRHFPSLEYAAARIARGSDVLGFDDERSTDHYWGPMLELFVSEQDREHWGLQIHDALAAELPFQVRGYSTHFRPFEGSEARFGRLGHLAQRGNAAEDDSQGYAHDDDDRQRPADLGRGVADRPPDRSVAEQGDLFPGHLTGIGTDVHVDDSRDRADLPGGEQDEHADGAEHE